MALRTYLDVLQYHVFRYHEIAQLVQILNTEEQKEQDILDEFKSLQDKYITIGKDEKQAKDMLLASIDNDCFNEGDPVSLEDWGELSADQLRDVIRFGDTTIPRGETIRKMNCYKKDTLITILNATDTIKDPLNNDYTAKSTEIDEILARSSIYKIILINPHSFGVLRYNNTKGLHACRTKLVAIFDYEKYPEISDLLKNESNPTLVDQRFTYSVISPLILLMRSYSFSVYQSKPILEKLLALSILQHDVPTPTAETSQTLSRGSGTAAR
jgi:hypothetical protein